MSLPDLPPPTGEPVAPTLAPPVPGGTDRWQRQSPRMLLVHPVRILGSFALPLVLAVLGISRGTDEDRFWVFAVVAGAVLAVVAGVVSWYVTRYRFTDEQVQLRTGLLSRRVLTAPLDRVRSVDIESSLLHRVLGLAKVKVGTGVDSTRIELDGVSREQAAELRTFLLRRGSAGQGPETPPAGYAVTPAGADPAPDGDRDEPAGAAHPAGAEQPETELARIDWGWLRYAPFSLSSLVVVAGAVGVLAQFGDDLPVDQVEVAQGAWEWVLAQALLVLVAMTLLAVVVGWVVVSTVTYVLTWWNLRVVREARGNLRITRGLLTTHSQTVERAKVRGARMGEPFLLRLVRGAELTALATGVGTGGTTKVLPPAPRAVVTDVGHELLEETGALTMALTGHGPRARRRIHVQHQWGTLFIVALLAVPTYLLDVGWVQWLPSWAPPVALVVLGALNAVVADSAWRNLGHGLTGRHLVVQTGAFVRSREVLELAGIIGWRLDQSFFQRRLGLADLRATTAAGSEVVTAPDIPLTLAVPLARRATPGMLEEFLA
ncbi:PH domain-containing protein [Ornithinimicrobium cerasi]|uniref:PH domain-containing protein n=1 Tax=Ornithinimicrobium cerasi TaxID=2248773 RepID=UPI000EFE19CD|nr:PH domain-containing protein [Ornithinimicrobium cerasi]